jgi:hypothetical protein
MFSKAMFALAIFVATASGAFGATTQSGPAAGGPLAKAARCFNYSEANSLNGRLSLIWIPRAAPCRPAIQGYGFEWRSDRGRRDGNRRVSMRGSRRYINQGVSAEGN